VGKAEAITENTEGGENTERAVVGCGWGALGGWVRFCGQGWRRRLRAVPVNQITSVRRTAVMPWTSNWMWPTTMSRVTSGAEMMP
jgi:hypothetical protein